MGGDVNHSFSAVDTTINCNGLRKKKNSDRCIGSTTPCCYWLEKNKTLSELELKKPAESELSLPAAQYRLRVYPLSNYNSGTLDRQRNWGPTVGVTLGYTLFDGFNRRREQKNARISVENRQLALEQSRLALESRFRQHVDGLSEQH